MLSYVIRRLGHAVIVVAAVMVVVFVLVRSSGDPTAFLLPPDAPASAREELRVELGLDEGVLTQFGIYVKDVVSGSFGTSLRWRQPAINLLADRAPATIRLAAAALLVSLIIAVPLGLAAAQAATKGRRWLDSLTMGFVLVGQSMPTFWLGLMLIFVFALRLRWLPPSGADTFASLVLPGVTLGLYSAALLARLLRVNVIEALRKDYVRTAKAKGVAGRTIIIKHVIRNAAIPVVTVLGLQIGQLLGGAVVTEYVFSYPGVGLLTLDAISQRDYPIVQAFVVLTALVIASINLLVDISYMLIDPRIRY